MDSRIREIHKSGLKNEEYLTAIYEADGDKKPHKFSCDLTKHLFATVYYGWLVGKYGNAWKEHL